MRIKLKYKFIFLLVIILIVSLFFSSSCAVIARIIGAIKSEVEEELEKEEQEEYEQHEETELSEGFEDYPEEPITYKGIIGDNDFFINMEIDLVDTEVSGTVYNNWEVSYLTADIKGVIYLSNYEIEADCDGFFVNRETDVSEDVHMKIKGFLSENLNNFSGSLEAGDFGTKSFTAQRE